MYSFRLTLFYLKEILIISVVWVSLTLFYVFIKYNEIPDQDLQHIYNIPPGITKATIYKISILIGCPLGLVLGVLYSLLYPRLYRTLSLWGIILVRIVVFSSLSVIILIVFAGGFDLHGLPSGSVVTFFTYMLLTETLIGVLVLLRRNLGHDYFTNTIINTYNTPKEEVRVFMFLDLEDSTPSAEKMGHLNFSRYIQDCFYDLSGIVLKYGGHIYQFVGDEAVITWRVSDSFDYVACVRMYYAYMDRIESKKKYYQIKHGCIPVFRCAIHGGKVSTALVGDYKKEIAYHGGVLNLCSRLQSACSKNNAYVLASAWFSDNLHGQSEYTLLPILLTDLKGIREDQSAYSIIRNIDEKHQIVHV